MTTCPEENSSPGEEAFRYRSHPPSRTNVIKLSIRGIDFGRNPFEKGFLPSHFPKTFKSLRKGVQGEDLFEKGFSP